MIYKGKRWTIVCADALDLLRSYNSEPFAGVIADPPYSSGGATRGDRMQSTTSKYVQTDSGARQRLADFEGDNRDQRAFTMWCSLWLMAAWRVSEPGAVLQCFTDWRQLPSMTDAVQAGGWVWRGIVPWNKGGGVRPQKGRPSAQCEYSIFATRGPHKAEADAPCMPGFFTFASPRKRVHIAEKPVPLLTAMAELARPDGLVLDPFVGSGAHGEGVLLAGRRYFGVELVPEIAALAAERLRAVEDGLRLQDRLAGQTGLFAQEDQNQ